MTNILTVVGPPISGYVDGLVYRLDPPLAHKGWDDGIEYVLSVQDPADPHLLACTAEGGVRDWDRLDDILAEAGYETARS